MRAIVDSGVLIAAVNSADPYHEESVRLLGSREFDLVIPTLCIAESSYLIAQFRGPQVEAEFIRGLAAFEVVAPIAGEWLRIAEIMDQYRDFPLGVTDASIVSLAERIDARTVMTLDHRHFAAVRPRHCSAFDLLPSR